MRDSSLRRSTRLTSSAICSGLGAGLLSSRLNTCRSWLAETTTFFPPDPAPLQPQEPQSQQRQGHVVVPAVPAPHLVLPQPHLPLALLKRLLGPVPLTARPDRLPQAAHPLPRVGQPVP